MANFAKPVPLVFGLAFDVEKASDRKSGFKPAEFDLGAGKNLFGDIRLDGFAALLKSNFAEKLVVVGGIEGRYKGENIPRARAITDMLHKDHGIPTSRLGYLVSASNTGGNIEMIRREVGGRSAPVVVSNHYHLPRAGIDFDEKSLRASLLPAESFILIHNPDEKEHLVERLGGGPLAERVVTEARGVADKLLGVYKPRTDADIQRSWWSRLLARS